MELIAAIVIPAAVAAVSVLSIRLAVRRYARADRPARWRDRPAAGSAPRQGVVSGIPDWRSLGLAAERWAERLRAELYRLPQEPSPATPPTSERILARPGSVDTPLARCASCGLEQPVDYVRCLRCGSADRTIGGGPQRQDPSA